MACININKCNKFCLYSHFFKSKVTKKNKIYIGFCLEDHNLESEALRKLSAKSLDYIVANKSDTIGQDHREVVVYSSKKDKPLRLNSSLMEVAYDLLALVSS